LIITIFGTIINFFMNDNFKYVALNLGIKDNFISIFYALSGLFNILAKFMAVRLWDRFNFRSFYLNPILRFFNILMVLIGCQYSSVFFLFSIFIS